MADDAKQAWNDVGERFASLGNRLSEKYRESGSGGEPDAAETQRKLQETAKEVGDQLSRAFDALGATIRDEEAKADLKQALNAFGDALGATFDEAGHAIRRTVGSSSETPPRPSPTIRRQARPTMADKTNPRDALAAIPLFAHLSSRQLRRIASSTNEDAYEAGDVIINEGGRSQSMFVIVEGTASVVRDGQTLAQCIPGEFFGELSMIDQRPRAASVVADTPMRCLVLKHEVLRDIVMSDPQVAWSLLKTLASRLRDD